MRANDKPVIAPCAILITISLVSHILLLFHSPSLKIKQTEVQVACYFHCIVSRCETSGGEGLERGEVSPALFIKRETFMEVTLFQETSPAPKNP